MNFAEGQKSKTEDVLTHLDMSLDEMIASHHATQRLKNSSKQDNVRRAADGKFGSATGKGSATYVGRGDFGPRYGYFKRSEQFGDVDRRGYRFYRRQPEDPKEFHDRPQRFKRRDPFQPYYRSGDSAGVKIENDDSDMRGGPSVRNTILMPSFAGSNSILQGIRRRNHPLKAALIENRLVAVSGLDYTVMTADLEELFLSVGAVEKCWIDYDRTDRSLGTGGVIFYNKRDAFRAVDMYNGRFIDSQPLQLELVAQSY